MEGYAFPAVFARSGVPIWTTKAVSDSADGSAGRNWHSALRNLCQTLGAGGTRPRSNRRSAALGNSGIRCGHLEPGIEGFDVSVQGVDGIFDGVELGHGLVEFCQQGERTRRC